MQRESLVVGNWKMNGSGSQVDDFAAALNRSERLSCEIGVCVPFVYIERMARGVAGSRVAVGGQNLARTAEPGAFTGEVNGAMLADAGAGDVIIGHSERREHFGESDAIVINKVGAALDAGLRPILCVGETKQQRDAGRVEQVLNAQIDAVFSNFDNDKLASLVVAYEPIWAIGTGDTATPAEAQSAHHHIRERIAEFDSTLAERCRIVYGGSVKPGNAAEIFRENDVDGALVGGASLDFDSFAAIAAAGADAGPIENTE